MSQVDMAEKCVQELTAESLECNKDEGVQERSQNGTFPPSQNLESLDEETSQRWNHPKGNIARVFCANYTLFMMGMNDAAYGALIPYLESFYNKSYTPISVIFLSPFVGYVLAALSNSPLHHYTGQRGISILCPSFRIVAYIIICVHPPYPALVIAYLLAGYGIGLGDAAWNAFVGDMENANELLGIMHGCYGLGGTVAPIVATSFVTRWGLEWYYYYYVMVGLALLELAFNIPSFWSQTAQKYRQAVAIASATTEESPHSDENESSKPKEKSKLRIALFTRPSARITWLCSLFLLGYVGIEVSIGGWLVAFMLRVRNGDKFASGMTATGFWLGLTVGRMLLGFVTPRIGEKIAISIYLPTAILFHLLFWLVPQFITSAVFVALVGFFIGPLFPAAIRAATKLLPKHLHVAAIGFAAAFGGTGAAILPFAVGAIAQAAGVQVLQPIVLAVLATILGIWICLPRMKGKVRGQITGGGEDENESENQGSSNRSGNGNVSGNGESDEERQSNGGVVKRIMKRFGKLG